jgi:hypothetical protein
MNVTCIKCIMQRSICAGTTVLVIASSPVVALRVHSIVAITRNGSIRWLKKMYVPKAVQEVLLAIPAIRIPLHVGTAVSGS